MPRVSVILNCYRQAAYVRQAVESVLAQSHQDFELLVVDNGSPDATPDILREFQGTPRVRLFLHKENKAISVRFNEAVKAASGELVSFLYSDDFYLPHKLETQVRAFDGLPASTGVVYAPMRWLNQITGQTWDMAVVDVGPDPLRSLLTERHKGTIDMISPMTRRACFLRHPFLEHVFAEGEGIFLRVALTHAFLRLPEPVAVSRDTGENRGKAISVNTEMHQQTLHALEADPAFRPELYREALRHYRARLLRNAGFCAARVGGDPAWARRALVKAIEIDPRHAVHYRTLIGLGLLALPSRVRTPLNALAHRLRGVRGNATSVAGYGGSAS
jgi:glycosyltransferase involved in cell wall biosynthesis